MKNTKSLFEEDNLKEVYSYKEFLVLMAQLVADKKTTGPNQSEDYAHYTKLNWTRMQRLVKTMTVSEALTELISSIDAPQKWYILTEAWCGDAAQCVPVLAKAAELNANIDLKLILRDENPMVMDAYTTNGGRSIPKLVALDGQKNELFTWGPRPRGAQDVMDDFRKNPGRPYAELAEQLQKWYNEDHGRSVQNELLSLLKGRMVKI